MNISILLLLSGINTSSTNDWLPSEKIGNATYEIVFEKCEEESIYNGRIKNAFSLGIVNRVSQKKSHIQFSAYADSIRDATIAFHDYFTFNAHSQFNYVGLQYIIDMNKEKIIDVLPNQGIWFSPSQRFIVYQSGYPTLALPD